MKYYEVGEVFTTEDGKTVRCVRSNVLCTGCVFITKADEKPRCRAMNIACSGRSREDKQDVVFEELEELKEHTEYPVGKVLVFEGKAVEVVGNNDDMSCKGCALFPYGGCLDIPCIPCERTDDKYIKFKKHVTEE